MPFYLLQDETVPEGIRRLVNEEIEDAIEEIDDPKLKRTDAVHQVRKRCKKIRGVLRLVRPRFEETYRSENAWFRDTARGLSSVRDAEAIIETYDDLMDRFGEQIDRRAFAPVRRALTRKRKRIVEETAELDRKLEEVRARLREAAERVTEWNLDAEEFDGIEGGLVQVYRRGRKAMAAAYESPTAENFHEWRKRVKYHGYHMRLLRDLWKPVMRPLRGETDDLSDLLGDDHNLAVFRGVLPEHPGQYGGQRDIQALLGLIDGRSAELRMKAKTIGTRVFAETPKAFGRRFGNYWSVWRPERKKSPKEPSAEPAVATPAG